MEFVWDVRPLHDRPTEYQKELQEAADGGTLWTKEKV